MPVSLREEAIRLLHDIPSAGHQGVKRTREKVREKFAWYGLSKAVAGYVSSCEIFNRNKMSDRKGKGPMTEYQAEAQMERVHLDLLGPLPRTPRGDAYILMMVDQFTKWVYCVPLPTQTAEEVARAISSRDLVFPFRFSDQGRNLESKYFTELCSVLEIHKARSTPYRPSANGQVQRYNER